MKRKCSEKGRKMITNKIQEFAEWTKHNFITMITILVCFMLCFLAIVMFSWLFGFWERNS